MDDKAAFLQAIAEQPADRTARLAFADFLEETGDTSDATRAEFIRAQCEAETVHPNSRQAEKLFFRTCDLFATHWLDWWEPVCTAVGLPEPHRPVRGVRGWLTRRIRGADTKPGFPYGTLTRDRFTVQVSCADTGPFGALTRITFAGGFPDSLRFLGQLSRSANILRAWRAASPLAALDLHGIVARDWHAIDGPHLAGLRVLSLSHGASTGLDAVAASPHLPQLEEMHLNPDRSNFHWAEEHYRAFAASSLPKRLRRLSVVIAGPADVQALVRAPLRNVTALTVQAAQNVTDRVEVGRVSNSAGQFLSSSALARVEELTLGPMVATALATTNCPLLARIRKLDVSYSSGLWPVFPLPNEDVFDSLEDLTLFVEGWLPVWIETLAHQPCIPRLKHLRLGGNLPPTPEAVSAMLRLVRALDPGRLETLRIGSRVCNADAVRTVLAERFGDRVRIG
jgi:uncharacterized protein (TIGR02996 family)